MVVEISQVVLFDYGFFNPKKETILKSGQTSIFNKTQMETC